MADESWLLPPESSSSSCCYSIVFSLFLLLLLFFLIRVFVVLRAVRRDRSSSSPSSSSFRTENRRKSAVRTLIVLGSGGHTTEMMKLVTFLSDNYSPRHYVVANTDNLSREKVAAAERLRIEDGKTSQYFLSAVPRSREVMQSWLSTLFSAFYSLVYSLFIVFSTPPDLVLCNGPGTCVPLCAAAFLSRVLFIKRTKIVFIESICRVNSLSLSGLLLYYFVDEFIVQWPQLKNKYSLVNYLGRIV